MDNRSVADIIDKCGFMAVALGALGPPLPSDAAYADARARAAQLMALLGQSHGILGDRLTEAEAVRHVRDACNAYLSRSTGIRHG